MAAFPVAMSLWPSRRGGLPQGASTCCGGGLRFCGPASACCYGVHPTPPRPGPVWLLLAGKPHAASAAWPSAARSACPPLPRCPASACRDGPHPVMWPCERPPRRGARGLPRPLALPPAPPPSEHAARGFRGFSAPPAAARAPVATARIRPPRSPLPRTALCYVIMGNQWVADFSQFRARRCGSHLAPPGGQAARGLRGLAPSGRASFPPSVPPAPPASLAAARAPAAAARIRPRASRCPASACRDGAHPPPGVPASRPGATPASLPPLPGAPRRGAARRRSSPRLGRSSAPRWWGSP